jgi:hypothetical protein
MISWIQNFSNLNSARFCLPQVDYFTSQTTMATKKQCTIRLPEHDLNFAEKLAQEWGMSRSQVIARLVRDFRKAQGGSNDSN